MDNLFWFIGYLLSVKKTKIDYMDVVNSCWQISDNVKYVPSHRDFSKGSNKNTTKVDYIKLVKQDQVTFDMIINFVLGRTNFVTQLNLYF